MTLKRKQSLDVDLIIEKLLEARYMEPKSEINLPVDQILMLIDEVIKVFMSQPVLLELPAPIKILGTPSLQRIISLGDTHGQYYELLRIFEQSGFPPESDYLFLGYYPFPPFSFLVTTLTGDRTALRLSVCFSLTKSNTLTTCSSCEETTNRMR